MPSRSPGVSGVAVATMAAGAVVLYAGLQNQPILDTLRAVLKGKQLPRKPGRDIIGELTANFASQLKAGLDASQRTINQNQYMKDHPVVGTDVVVDAERYLGVPYRFGGASPSGMDCSGLVNYVVGHDLGLPIPGSDTGAFSGHGPTTVDWYGWGGAVTLANQAAAEPGDLVCWASHMGIYAGNGYMIHAPQAGQTVEHAKVWGGAIYRRLKVTSRPADPGVSKGTVKAQ